ncbi:hypothetical protein BDN72DRAFT_440041 [Pluteus cervinus]|uniref:Uncharacterized protein n=1 Tax=Pluteus cervinus TaxID=181527 RepID=A0ACD3A742_9AGAR|nr:hypothetical protein BDN72DRAFT_440041 [Pluteus cervinus]
MVTWGAWHASWTESGGGGLSLLSIAYTAYYHPTPTPPVSRFVCAMRPRRSLGFWLCFSSFSFALSISLLPNQYPPSRRNPHSIRSYFSYFSLRYALGVSPVVHTLYDLHLVSSSIPRFELANFWSRKKH